MESILVQLQKIRARQEMRSFLKVINDNKDNKCIEETLIFKALKLISESGEFDTVLSEKRVYYRSRGIDLTQKDQIIGHGISVYGKEMKTSGFDKYGSKEPPIGIASNARNNVHGMGYLYLSEDEYTACAEIKPTSDMFISLAKFEIAKPLTVIDLLTNKRIEQTEKFHNEYKIYPAFLITEVMNLFTVNKSDEVYATTQFISDYFRKCGYGGIRYKSALTGKGNLTIFNSDERFIHFISSKIVYCSRPMYSLINLDDSKEIQQSDKEGPDILKLKEDLRYTLERIDKESERNAN